VPHLIFIAIMHPNSTLRTSWDTYILLLLFTVCILVPYMICFDITVNVLSPIGVPYLSTCKWLLHQYTADRICVKISTATCKHQNADFLPPCNQ
jgi:hypothetical protein